MRAGGHSKLPKIKAARADFESLWANPLF